MKSLVDYYRAIGQELTAKAVEMIQRGEAMNRVWKQCEAARGLNKDGGLSYVLVPENPEEDPKQCEQWKKLQDPKEVKAALLERLRKHFSQSKDCQLTSPPIDVTMDFEGSCEKANAILTGQYDTSGLDETTGWLIEALQSLSTDTEPIDYKLTRSELMGKLRVWDERTSTSPMTGVHLGHGKAYYAPHALKTQKQLEKEQAASPQNEALQQEMTAEELDEIRNYVIQGHLTLLNYALHFGYSYERWQTVVNSLLKKDEGDPKIHRLRVIHLYEWDFNLILCVKWRNLLHRCCDNKSINSSCYGSHPGRTTYDPVFLREMQYELCRLLRYPLIHFDNDATSCYDRIPCFLANVASQKYGQNVKVCVVQGKTLRQAKYYLKTKFGLSDEHAQHTKQMPWFGTGQGSGNSPMYWLLISSTMYDVFQQKSTGGALFESPDKTMSVRLYQSGFVDDVQNTNNSSWTAENQDQALFDLFKQASEDSQLWNDILAAGNQSLELPKCKYHVMHYDFKDTGDPVLSTAAQPPAPLQVRDDKGELIEIQHVPNNKAIKYLGFLKCLDNQNQQKEALIKKADNFARVINTSYLNRKSTETFYRGIYEPSIGYVLPLCYFRKEELERIQKKAHQAMVNSCGYNRCMAKAILYGPKDMGGAAFFHLWLGSARLWTSANIHEILESPSMCSRTDAADCYAVGPILCWHRSVYSARHSYKTTTP